MNAKELKAKFGKSDDGNFYIEDTIGVPHPYCVTPKHVAVASDQFGGMLGEAAVEAAEVQGAHCGMRNCRLKWKEHEQALLVTCAKELKDAEGKVVPELHAYLLKCKPLAEEGKYAGFAFKKA